MGHARALLALKSEAEQQRLRDEVLQESLSVRATEARVRARAKRPPGRQSKPSHVLAMEDALGRHLNTRVAITLGRRSGKIEIAYRGEEELQRLLGMLQPQADAMSVPEKRAESVGES
jgi:ParB family chromosome partitioning protein